MSDADDAIVDVHVEVPPTEVEAEASTPEPTTPEVHVHNEPASTNSDPGIHPALAEFMSNTTRELQELRSRTEGAEAHASDAHTLASGAQSAVGSAVQDVQSIIEQASNDSLESAVPQVPTPELDSDPHKPHLWFRKTHLRRKS